MAMRVRFQYQSGNTLGYSIERLADGLFYDFSNSTFTASPVTQVQTLPEDSGNFVGRYIATLTPTPQATFPDGDYCVTIHNTALANSVVDHLASVMHSGDDATVIPTASGGSGGGGFLSL